MIDSRFDKLKNVKKLGSITTLISELEYLQQRLKEDEMIFFRGQCDEAYTLQPSIYRTNKLIENEDYLFKDLISKCPNDFEECTTTFERLVKMQHYLLPTRLLDITTNPLVALYFACQEITNNKDGRIFYF